jgi:hypothetical protein
MKTITSTDTVTIKVSKSDLLEGKWLHFQLLSKKLGEIENQKKLPYKTLRNKFYNSRACNKYNMQDIAGLPCIDVKNPMKDKASLELVFEEE